MSTLFEKLSFGIRMTLLVGTLVFSFYLDFGVALIACGATGYAVIDLLDHLKPEQQKGTPS